MVCRSISVLDDSIVHGMKLKKIIAPTDNMIDVLNEINHNWMIDHILTIRKVSPKIMKNNARRFMESRFRLNKVLYKNVLLDIETLLLKGINNQNLFLAINNSIGIRLNPFLLPVSFTAQKDGMQKVVEDFIYFSNDDCLRNLRISVSRIVLDKVVTEMTESTYVHEITHTQVLEHKGIIENYFNGEVLPIFLELLKVYESGNQNLMDLYDSNRFECLVDYFNCLDDSVIFPGDYTEDTLYKCSMYAESIVKAYSLFIEYVKGSSLVKKYILNGIQDIFDGNLKLEEFLSCFGITFESCFNDQKLLKYFCERKK